MQKAEPVLKLQIAPQLLTLTNHCLPPNCLPPPPNCAQPTAWRVNCPSLQYDASSRDSVGDGRRGRDNIIIVLCEILELLNWAGRAVGRQVEAGVLCAVKYGET